MKKIDPVLRWAGLAQIIVGAIGALILVAGSISCCAKENFSPEDCTPPGTAIPEDDRLLEVSFTTFNQLDRAAAQDDKAWLSMLQTYAEREERLEPAPQPEPQCRNQCTRKRKREYPPQNTQRKRPL